VEVQYEQQQDGIVSIRLNRPQKMNAFSVSLERDFVEAIRRACADDAVRVVIFSGAGRGFSGGWDLGSPDLTDVERRPFHDLAGLHTWVEVVQLLRRPDKLFICAVHGVAAGQGLELCIASDLVVAAEGTKFYFAETRVGFNMTSGTARLLTLLVGLANARRLALLGATIDAAEALRLGLIVKVTPPGEHEAGALELAAEALKGAPLALAAQKQLLDAGAEMSLAATIEAEVQTSYRLTITEDHQEAKRAFAEKRSPVFRGR
jgi:2-(1,2-epoxy-1,2-dihydrophenyl)acetyl-CoA isomerase